MHHGNRLGFFSAAAAFILFACHPLEIPAQQNSNQPPVDFPCDSDGLCPGRMTCNAATGTCEGGGSASCVSPLSACGDRCAFLLADDANCGACGHACTTGQHCANATCTGGNMSCVFCAPGVPCVNGMCSCEGRGEACSGVLCMDTQQLAFSCGTCFQPCGTGEICRSGACTCPSGEKSCGGDCRNVQSDAAQCGDCDHACQGAQVCEHGGCVTACTINTADACGDGKCWDIQSDAKHCGSACATCSRGQVCNSGTCQCPAQSQSCGGACVDTLRDAVHCGDCNHACAVGEECVTGQCACQAGLTACAGACVSTQDDATHCGACGHACGAGQVCLDGQCAAACPETRQACSGFCLGGSHPQHCGGCDSACDPGEACVDGSCARMQPAVECSACPCDACDVGHGWLCCMQHGAPTCVDGTRCPQ